MEEVRTNNCRLFLSPFLCRIFAVQKMDMWRHVFRSYNEFGVLSVFLPLAGRAGGSFFCLFRVIRLYISLSVERQNKYPLMLVLTLETVYSDQSTKEMQSFGDFAKLECFSFISKYQSLFILLPRLNLKIWLWEIS